MAFELIQYNGLICWVFETMGQLAQRSYYFRVNICFFFVSLYCNLPMSAWGSFTRDDKLIVDFFPLCRFNCAYHHLSIDWKRFSRRNCGGGCWHVCTCVQHYRVGIITNGNHSYQWRRIQFEWVLISFYFLIHLIHSSDARNQNGEKISKQNQFIQINCLNVINMLV